MTDATISINLKQNKPVTKRLILYEGWLLGTRRRRGMRS